MSVFLIILRNISKIKVLFFPFYFSRRSLFLSAVLLSLNSGFLATELTQPKGLEE